MKWRKSPEEVLDEVADKHGIEWDVEAMITLFSLFIQSVSTQKQFRQFLVKHAKAEKKGD